MAWEVIERQRGLRQKPSLPSVSLGWRMPSGGKNWYAAISLTRALVEQLGWQDVKAFLVSRDRLAGRLSLKPSDDPRAYSSRPSDGTLSVLFPLEGVTSKRRSAHAVRWEHQDGELVIHLPDWAAPDRASIRGARTAAAAARARFEAAPKGGLS